MNFLFMNLFLEHKNLLYEFVFIDLFLTFVFMNMFLMNLLLENMYLF